MSTSAARLLPLTCFLVSAALSIAAIAVIPHERDLYNLLYANARPQRPESTKGFFIVFPAMQLVLALGTLRARPETRSDARKLMGTFLVTGLSLLFTATNALRFLAAWRFFH